MKNKIIISILLWALVFAWMGVIFSMSAEPATESTETSGNTIRAIYRIIYPGFRDMTEAEQNVIIENSQNIVRKLAHFSIYTILGMLASIAVAYHSKKNLYRLLFPFVIGILYAVSDEIHQLFVPGRSGQISDVIIDSLGVILGCLSVYFIFKIIVVFAIIKRE